MDNEGKWYYSGSKLKGSKLDAIINWHLQKLCHNVSKIEYQKSKSLKLLHPTPTATLF